MHNIADVCGAGIISVQRQDRGRQNPGCATYAERNNTRVEATDKFGVELAREIVYETAVSCGVRCCKHNKDAKCYAKGLRIRVAQGRMRPACNTFTS